MNNNPLQQTVRSIFCIFVVCYTSITWGFSSTINVPPQSAPQSIGSDTQLNLYDQGVLPENFLAGALDGSSSNVEVNISGGTVGHHFSAYAGSTVNVAGGSLDFRFWTFAGSTTNITGGTFGRDTTFGAGSEVNIYGGAFDDEVHGLFRSTLNVWGGDLNYFQAHDQSVISFFGTNFSIDGIELANLIPGEAFIITDRDVPFSATLADGSAFSMDLNPEHPPHGHGAFDLFEPGATLVVTLVPSMAGDFDEDGDVDGIDFMEWQLGNSPTPMSLTDINHWELNYGFATHQPQEFTVVPEPAAQLLMIAVGIGLLVRRS